MDMYEPGHDNDSAFDNYDQWKTSEPDENYPEDLYLLFAGDHYYPTGGVYDFQGCFTTIAEAHTFAEEHQFDWAHIARFFEGAFHIIQAGHDLGKPTGGWLED